MRIHHLIIGLLLLASCSGDDDVTVAQDPGYEYFPLETGHFHDYRIYTKKYFLRPDSNAGQVIPDSTERTVYVRAVIQGKILDIVGDSATRIEFFSKQQLEDDWSIQPDSIAIAKVKLKELVYSANNQTFVKLAFPIKSGLEWNGNKFNSLGEETYLIESTGLSYVFDSMELSPAISVLQSDISNLIEVNQRSEEYVLNVGLARKNSLILQYRQVNGQVLTNEIDKGQIYRQELIGYGKN